MVQERRDAMAVQSRTLLARTKTRCPRRGRPTGLRREPRHGAGQSLPDATGRRCDPDGRRRDVTRAIVSRRCLCTHGSPRPARARLDLRGVWVRSQPEGRPCARLLRVRPVRDADQQPGDGRPRPKRDGAVRHPPREPRPVWPRARQNKASELWSMTMRPGTGPAIGRWEAGARVQQRASAPCVCPAPRVGPMAGRLRQRSGPHHRAWHDSNTGSSMIRGARPL